MKRFLAALIAIIAAAGVAWGANNFAINNATGTFTVIKSTDDGSGNQIINVLLTAGSAVIGHVITDSGSVVSIGTAASDGSTTITAGGTAQNLFSGATPTNGWAVYNPDATEDCWVSDSTTAAANNTGSIRLALNGGGYETPPGYKPFSAVSVVCATTAHKLTARKW